MSFVPEDRSGRRFRTPRVDVIMPYEFRLTRRIEFSETDMAGIVHFSNFFRYMESAEHAFFRSLGFSIASTEANEWLGWPRVRASCDYRRPIRFEDEIEIHLLVRRKRTRSIEYAFIFRKCNDEADMEIARGTLVVASVRRQADRGMISVPIPEHIAAKIEAAPPDLLN
jgi:YbgC/YbaW family acyl-CoA thioester hydrolase